MELRNDQEYQASKQDHRAGHLPNPGLWLREYTDGRERCRPSRRRDGLTDEANDKHDAQSISEVLPPMFGSEEQDPRAAIPVELQPRPPTAYDAQENHYADERQPCRNHSSSPHTDIGFRCLFSCDTLYPSLHGVGIVHPVLSRLFWF